MIRTASLSIFPVSYHFYPLCYLQPSVSMSRSQHKYQPPSQKPSSQKVCYYYNHGGCKNGASCPFLHVRNKEEAIAEKLDALVDIMKSNGLMAPTQAQKRQSPSTPPAKRITVVDENNTDPLGYNTPKKQESLEVRGARARHNLNQMIDAHLAKNARKANPVSVTNLVVRTRAEILAAQEEEKKKANSVSLPPSQSTQEVASVQPDTNDSVNDMGDDDDDDDAAYMDGMDSCDELTCRACKDGSVAGNGKELTVVFVEQAKRIWQRALFENDECCGWYLFISNIAGPRDPGKYEAVGYPDGCERSEHPKHEERFEHLHQPYEHKFGSASG